MTKDDVNRNYDMKYDHRNLMTYIRSVRTESGLGGQVDVSYVTLFKYDEVRLQPDLRSCKAGTATGNRVRKTYWKYLGTEQEPVFEGDNPSWSLQSDEYYVRDVSGKEIAIYNGSSLTQCFVGVPSGEYLVDDSSSRRLVEGLDNVGKINADTTRNYYLKDHLGSIRVVLNSTNTVVSAQDYDTWGYPLENRTYNSTAMRYDFTGKERDVETSYDCFGARYYDSRIGRWGGVDTLFMKHYDFNPYNYALVNPLKYIDPDGKQVDFHEQQAKKVLDKEILIYEKIGKEVFYKTEKVAIATGKVALYLGRNYAFRLAFQIAPNPWVKAVVVVAAIGYKVFIEGLNDADGEKEKKDSNETKENNNDEKKEPTQQGKKQKRFEMLPKNFTGF